MGFVQDTWDGIRGKTAADASTDAAGVQAQAQREALEYLKEREQIPRQYSEGALTQLGGLFGLAGGDPNAAAKLRQNPMYQATLGMLPQQEEAILRNQSATGAMRTGGTDMMLAENQRMNQLQAYQNAIGGLQGLAGLPSNANQIAQGMAGIGQTQAQGMIGAAQAEQQGLGNMMNLGMNAVALAGFSDTRLKKNIRAAGERRGHAWYTWTWNYAAEKIGLSGDSEGVLAQEVAKTNPDAIGMRQGFLTVNYEKLGLA